MTTLLHISASPRGAASESRAIAETFLDAYRHTHPDDEIVEWDLWDGTLPEFGPAAGYEILDPALRIAPHAGGPLPSPRYVLVTGLAGGGAGAWIVLERA